MAPISEIVTGHMSYPDGMAEWIEHPSPILGDQGIRTSWLRSLVQSIQWFRDWYLLVLPARRLALLGYGTDWLAQYQDNMTDWKSGHGAGWPGFTVGWHYKFTMIVHCHKLVPILIWQGCKTTRSKQTADPAWCHTVPSSERETDYRSSTGFTHHHAGKGLLTCLEAVPV